MINMQKKYINLSLKLKLFYPVLIALTVAITVFAILIIGVSRNSIYKVAENDMQLQVKTIKKMFERERQLKLEKVKTDLKVAHHLFYDKKFEISDNKIEIPATNQFTLKKHNTSVKSFMHNGKQIYLSNDFPNQCFKLFGGTTTIFQKIDSGFLRVSTNVLNNDGSVAVGTFIPNSSIVAMTINNNETYYGRAFVVNDWYITAYEPIIYNNELVGALYVGGKEKDIEKLEKLLESLKLAKTGFPFVFDSEFKLIMQPRENINLIKDTTLMKTLAEQKQFKGVFLSEENNTEYIIASDYYEDFDIYIATVVPSKELTHTSVKTIIINTIIIGLILLALVTILILSTTSRRVYRLLNAIKLSNVKLKSTKEALKQSEENFETIFQSSSDEIFVSDMQANIIEANNQATELLGYTHEELLQMNFLDLKPLKQAEQFLLNRETILSEGSHMFDSEYITKSGEIVPVEINSRVIEFNGERVILSISRNLLKRKEMERKVLSAVIQTEEKERERFSKDMHDGIGPLLSTVKLYVNELGTSDIADKEKIEYVNQVNKMLDDAVASIREISNNLMPRAIHEYGLIKALDAFCKKVNQTGKIHVEFDSVGIESTLDKNVQLILFRVISELLTNTIKHAKAENAHVKLHKSDDSISLVFIDDGIGFDSKKVMENKNTGIGLKSIVSRIKSINGSVEIISKEGEGFKIIIEI